MPPIQSPTGYQPQPPQGPVLQYQSANSRKSSPFNPLLIVTIVLVVALICSLIFAIWAYTERDTYKNKTDEVVAKEVALATQRVSDEKDKEFVEKEKFPLKEYKAPATFGGTTIMYPKTWSATIDERNAISGTFHPNYIPAGDAGVAFALKLEIVDRTYETEVKAFDGRVKNGKVKVSPYRAPKVDSVAGSRVEGEIVAGQRGVMILLPLRDKTIKVSTQSQAFVKDFDEIILANLVFVP